jgi:hypothetical protein
VLIALEAGDLVGFFRVKKVEIKGTELLSRSAILVHGGLDELVGEKIYSVNPEPIISTLESHPRIYRVNIIKEWPSTISVEIEEERETLRLLLPSLPLIVSQGGVVVGIDTENAVKGLIPVKIFKEELVRELENNVDTDGPVTVDYSLPTTELLRNLGRCAQDAGQFFPDDKLSIEVDEREQLWLLIDGFPRALLGRQESYAMIFKKLEKLRKMSGEGMVGIDHFDLRHKHQVRIRLARP